MIINSLLDTDLYKLTMQQIVLHKFPEAEVEYKFVCRNENINFKKCFDEINREINHLCSLNFKQDELEYLSTLSYLKKDYIRYLKNFKLDRKDIVLSINRKGKLDVTIKGNWFHTILFEIPVLAIINESYCKYKIYEQPEIGIERIYKLTEKLDFVKNTNIKFTDFGTRRRFSFNWHQHVIYNCGASACNNFYGTSNLFFAKHYKLKPIGTMAHEYLQAMQSYVRLRDSQKFALQTWADEYRGDLGIALTDVINTDAFLKDFDLYFAKLFDGLRHDSGDPYSWGDKVIKHYEKLGIDPKTKTLVFSDNLNFPYMKQIFNRFNNEVNVSFGIGTNLTNDIGLKPLNIVIKMISCNGKPVAKISDSPGKTICKDKSYINYLKTVFNV
jgi:nicotinate phosphoribosyltransferase